MERLIRWVDGLSERVAAVTLWLLLAVVLVAAFNALARYAGASLGASLSSNGLLELQWYLFGAVFLFGGAHTLRRGAHVRVDVLYDRLPRRARAWIDVVGHVALLLPFCAFAVWVSLAPVADSWRRGEVSPDPGGLPRYPIKTIVPLAFALLALQGLAELARRLRELREGEPHDGASGGGGGSAGAATAEPQSPEPAADAAGTGEEAGPRPEAGGDPAAEDEAAGGAP